MIHKWLIYPIARKMQSIFEVDQDKAMFDATSVFLSLLIINQVIMLWLRGLIAILDIDSIVVDLIIDYIHFGLIVLALISFGHLYPGSTWKSFLAGIFGYIIMGWEDIPRSEIPYRTITVLGGILAATLPGPVQMLMRGCIADYFLVIALAMVLLPVVFMLLWWIGKLLKFIIIDIDEGDDHEHGHR